MWRIFAFVNLWRWNSVHETAVNIGKGKQPCWTGSYSSGSSIRILSWIWGGISTECLRTKSQVLAIWLHINVFAAERLRLIGSCFATIKRRRIKLWLDPKRTSFSMRVPYYPCLEHIQQQPACNLLYVKQQEGCYIILVYKISLIIESLFLYHAAFLKERKHWLF